MTRACGAAAAPGEDSTAEAQEAQGQLAEPVRLRQLAAAEKLRLLRANEQRLMAQAQLAHEREMAEPVGKRRRGRNGQLPQMVPRSLAELCAPLIDDAIAGRGLQARFHHPLFHESLGSAHPRTP